MLQSAFALPLEPFSSLVANATMQSSSNASEPPKGSSFETLARSGIDLIRIRYPKAQLTSIGAHNFAGSPSSNPKDFRELGMLAHRISSGQLISTFTFAHLGQFFWNAPQVVGESTFEPIFRLVYDVRVTFEWAFTLLYQDGESRGVVSVTLSRKSSNLLAPTQPYYCFEFNGPQGIEKGSCIGAMDGKVYPRTTSEPTSGQDSAGYIFGQFNGSETA